MRALDSRDSSPPPRPQRLRRGARDDDDDAVIREMHDERTSEPGGKVDEAEAKVTSSHRGWMIVEDSASMYLRRSWSKSGETIRSRV